MNYKKKNKYNEVLTKAIDSIREKERIENIAKFLENNPNKILAVEKILYER